MKQCVSMYFGGDIVAAEDCDFEDYRKLGLQCPFCKEPLFLRAGFVRDRQGKQSIVNACFSHYSGGGMDDCEARSLTQSGRDEIKRNQFEARGQRLDLYNKRCWEMIINSMGVSAAILKPIKKIFSDSDLLYISREVRRYWRRSQEAIYQNITVLIDAIREDKSKRTEYFRLECDLKIHQAICFEVVDFLQSDKAGFVWQKLILLAALKLNSDSKNAFANTQKQQQIKLLSDCKMLTEFSISRIVGTRWTEQLQKHLEQNKGYQAND